MSSDLSARAAIRRLGGVMEQRIDEARSESAFVALIRECHGTLRNRAMLLAESWFWMGKAVAKARSFAYWGSAPVDTMAKRTGVPAATLRNAAAFYDTFIGNFDAMADWAAAWIAENNDIRQADIRALVAANKDRRYISQSISNAEASDKRYTTHWPIAPKHRESLTRFAKNHKPVVAPPRLFRKAMKAIAAAPAEWPGSATGSFFFNGATYSFSLVIEPTQPHSAPEAP